MKGVRSNIFYSGLEDDTPINNSSSMFLFLFLHVKITSNPFVKKKTKQNKKQKRTQKEEGCIGDYRCYLLLSVGESCWLLDMIALEPLLSEASIYGTPPFRGHQIWSRKKLPHNLWICYRYWRDTSFQGKGTQFLGPKTWVDLHSGDTKHSKHDWPQRELITLTVH